MGVRHTWRVWSPARKAGVVIDATKRQPRESKGISRIGNRSNTPLVTLPSVHVFPC